MGMAIAFALILLMVPLIAELKCSILHFGCLYIPPTIKSWFLTLKLSHLFSILQLLQLQLSLMGSNSVMLSNLFFLRIKATPPFVDLFKSETGLSIKMWWSG